MREAAAELGVGLAERLLGINLHESRQIDQDEQQISDLPFDFVVRRLFPSIREFVQFLFEFQQHLLGVVPIKAGACGA